MKCNYQSWRSQHDGIPSPRPPPLPRRRRHSSAAAVAARRPPDTPGTPLAFILDACSQFILRVRGAHIINLIKRSALKIVLLVRQLLTAVTFPSRSFARRRSRPPPSFLSWSPSPPPPPPSVGFYHLSSRRCRASRALSLSLCLSLPSFCPSFSLGCARSVALVLFVVTSRRTGGRGYFLMPQV